MRCILVVVVVSALATSAFAQVTGTAGPTITPLGCPVDITIANDTNAPITTGACPFTVDDAAGNQVYAPGFCILILITINPGDTWTTQWDQRDSLGNQVPPGIYTVNLSLPGVGIVALPSIGVGLSGPASIANLGPPRVGKTRNFSICAPAYPNATYLMAASSGTSGIATCGAPVPLTIDALFAFSTTPNNGVFLDFAGTLDASGYSNQPAIAVPNHPGLVGYSFTLCFVAIDPVAACPIGTVSLPTGFTIQ